MRMRDLISLVEGAVPLARVDVDDVLHRLEQGDMETGNWLVRAFDALGDRRPDEFLHMLAGEIEKAKASIGPVGDTITLYRGLTRPADGSPDGVHWTPNPKRAKAFGDHVYSREVAATQIDWVATVIRRIGWPHEEEISLFV